MKRQKEVEWRVKTLSPTENMKILVLDTETTSLDKPFCYDFGGIIYDTGTGEMLEEKSWIIEQVWYNLPLFESAYYKEKRLLYVGKLRSRSAELIKFGYAMSRLRYLIRKHEVTAVFAYNSNFDDRVLSFNCDWYKVINPIEHLPVYDIRAFVHEKLAWQPHYQAFCEKFEMFTDAGNYSTTAEAVYKYIVGDNEFIEEHTGLEDSRIELQILQHCVNMRDDKWENLPTKTYGSIPRIMERTLTVEHKGEVFTFDYTKRNNRDKGQKIILK